MIHLTKGPLSWSCLFHGRRHTQYTCIACILMTRCLPSLLGLSGAGKGDIVWFSKHFPRSTANSRGTVHSHISADTATIVEYHSIARLPTSRYSRTIFFSGGPKFPEKKSARTMFSGNFGPPDQNFRGPKFPWHTWKCLGAEDITLWKVVYISTKVPLGYKFLVRTLLANGSSTLSTILLIFVHRNVPKNVTARNCEKGIIITLKTDTSSGYNWYLLAI